MEARNNQNTRLAKKAVAEFWLWFGHEYLGTHLHHTGTHPNPYRMLCSLRKPMDRKHL